MFGGLPAPPGTKAWFVSNNKAGYTATPVACRWAGAVFEVTWSLRQEQWGHRPQKPKKVKCDRRTDRLMDGPMDGPKKRAVESRSTRLKSDNRLKYLHDQFAHNTLFKWDWHFANILNLKKYWEKLLKSLVYGGSTLWFFCAKYWFWEFEYWKSVQHR